MSTLFTRALALEFDLQGPFTYVSDTGPFLSPSRTIGPRRLESRHLEWSPQISPTPERRISQQKG